ncbi:MAG: D-alanine--D-alanine ligase [Patescibacteria group bacterium]
MRTVAILRGGPSEEHDVSLKTAHTVRTHLSGRARCIDIYIDKAGTWHVRGVPTTPDRALTGADTVFNALHGTYGEDGTVQRVLDRLGVTYTGSGALSSAMAMNKLLSKELAAKAGIKVPRHLVITATPDLDEQILVIFRSFPMPAIVKPAASGSSVGVTLARSFQEFSDAIRGAFKYSKDVLVEEYIRGREATVGIIDGWRNQSQYALPPVEIIIPKTSLIYDTNAKYGGMTAHVVPAQLERSDTDALLDAALLMHNELQLRDYSRSDFIVTPRSGVYYLETNSLPGLTADSNFPKSIKAVGGDVGQFIDHLVDLSSSRK